LVGDVTKLKNKTENCIVAVNQKIREVEEVQSQQMSEARARYTAIKTKLSEHQQGVEISLNMFKDELNEFKNKVAAECLVMSGDKLDVAGKDNSPELGKLDKRLDTLEKRVAAAVRHDFVPAASTEIHVNGNKERGQTGLASANIGTNGSRHSVGGCREQSNPQEVEVLPSRSIDPTNVIHDVIVKVARQGNPQFIHDLAKDIGLPKFMSPDKQNIIHFLNDLEAYFQLRGIPESLKVALAKSAVIDSYTSQWINTVYKDLRDYHQFKEAITEFLWGPQAQARWRCALYQGRYNGGAEESMAAHFLRYSAVASSLTPRLTEMEIVEIISCHYPAHVQRTLLSAGVKTIRDVLSLLNRLESLETYGEGISKSGGSARNQNNLRESFFRDRVTPAFQNVRNMRYQGTHNNDRNRQRNDYRPEKGGERSERGVQEVQCRAASLHDHGGRRALNPHAMSYAQRGAIGESSLNGTELDQGN
jgi:hypothetical protein